MTTDTRAAWWLDRAFIYVGRMDPSKGVRVTIEAYASLARTFDAPPPLWLVGGIPREIERLRAETASVLAPLEERGLITWWGFQRSAMIAGLFSRSVALVVHSQYEPGGRVVLEALSAGLPVIATPFGFAREFVQDWVSGFIVDYGDVELLRVRMEHFASQPLLRNAMGPNGQSIVINALNTWRFLDAHCEAYEDALLQTTRRSHGGQTTAARSCDVLHTRTFTPTYPLSRALDDGIVAEVVRTVRPDLQVLPRRTSRIPEWEATNGTDAWILNQVQPRFEVRPLWDRRFAFDSIRTAEDRLATVRLAGSYPPFLPVTIVSESHRLVMRPAGQPVARSTADITAFTQTLRMLWSYEVPLLSDALVDRRPRVSIDSVAEVLLSLRRLAREIRPAFRCSTISPELGWQLLLLHPGLSTTGLWTAGDIETGAAFADLATQVRPRVVLTHGQADVNAFMTQYGALCLVSGEDVECAVVGKDLACLLLHTVGESDLAAARPILDACDREERQAVLAWTGLLAFEGVCRNAALRRPSRLQFYRRLWNAASMLLHHAIR